ncbi:MAG TPA: hypothetical protein VIU64_03540 [Polyangia bacterium]
MRSPLSTLRLVVAVAVCASAGFGVAVPAARADAPMVKYVGMHPLPPHQGEFCYIDAIHYHRLGPVDMRVYATVKAGADGPGQLYVGDPAWLGYDGPKVGYFGPHPLEVPLAPEAGRLFCYISGAHHHVTAPPPSSNMVLKDGVYWYLGPLPPPDAQRAWINEVHAIKSYVPPKVDLSAAPSGYKPFDVAPRAAQTPGGTGAAPGVTAKPAGGAGAAGTAATAHKAKAAGKPVVGGVP